MSLFSFSRKYLTGFLTTIFRLKVIGQENIPTDRPFIVCSNHRSNHDPVILGASLYHDLFFMAKAELFKVPLLKQLIVSFGAFPVNRGKTDVKAITFAKQLVKENKILTMFPEGTRTKELHEPKKFKSGVALLAYQTKSPVLPVAICSKKVGLFRKNILRIGTMVEYDELGFTTGDSKNLREVSENLRIKVTDLINQNK